MSCLTTWATRRSRSVPAAVLIASAAASSHDVLLVPMISVTLYTLMTLSFGHVRPAPGLLPPACHTATRPGRRYRQVTAGFFAEDTMLDAASKRASHYSLQVADDQTGRGDSSIWAVRLSRARAAAS